jgi:release factor glutamine methyltransferase
MTWPPDSSVIAGDDRAARRSLEQSLAAILGSDREARWIVEDAFDPGTGVAIADAPSWARSLAERRAAGEPLQYLLGHWPFRNLDLLVDRRALIPRPETEWVTDVALAELDRLLAVGGAPTVVDLGTGTGAIALSIAVERSGTGLEVSATDVDPAALELAARNAERVAEHQAAAGAVALRAGSWWEALHARERGRISLVVSNPPYVAAEDWTHLDPVVRAHEPYGALVAAAGRDGTPGFACIEAILSGAGEWLSRPGTAVIELAPPQADAAVRAAERLGSAEAMVLPDLAGRPRALVARFA